MVWVNRWIERIFTIGVRRGLISLGMVFVVMVMGTNVI